MGCNSSTNTVDNFIIKEKQKNYENIINIDTSVNRFVTSNNNTCDVSYSIVDDISTIFPILEIALNTNINYDENNSYVLPHKSSQLYSNTTLYDQDIYEYEYSQLSLEEKKTRKDEIVKRLQKSYKNHIELVYKPEPNVLKSHEDVRLQLLELFTMNKVL